MKLAIAAFIVVIASCDGAPLERLVAPNGATPGGLRPNVPSSAQVCGDGRIQAPEQCDDGNTTSGDGCSSTCQMESGYVCTGSPSTCQTYDLLGKSTPLSMQCTTNALHTQTPFAVMSFTRTSDAWCTRSDGTMVRMATNVPRRERMGILVEPASSNSVTDPRDLSTANWTRSSMTCAHTATGPDGVANSASTCTATGSNGTVVQTVTIASAKRSSSMRIKRRTGTGSVLVSRNNFSTTTDIGSLISSTTWTWVRAGCRGTGPTVSTDLNYNGIDNCADASNLTATAANPTIGIKIATSGDAVDVDFVQDEAQEFATSPMAGFSRAMDNFSDATDKASLPTTQGELSVDFTPMWSAGLATYGTMNLIQTFQGASGAGVGLTLTTASGAKSGAINNGSGAGTQFFSSTASETVGLGSNLRTAWGGGNAHLFANGEEIKTFASAFIVPSTHTIYAIGQSDVPDNEFAGWISRVRWTSGAIGTFMGSNLVVRLVGDSIVDGTLVADGSRPHQAFATDIGAGLYTEKYVFDDGVSGNTLEQCQTRWNAIVDAAVAAGLTSHVAMVLQCGINSISIDGTAATISLAETVINYAISNGVTNVIISTITPAIGNQPQQDFNAAIQTWAAANNIAFADTYSALVDPNRPGWLNPAYDSGDNAHPNAAGSAAEALVWVNAGKARGYW